MSIVTHRALFAVLAATVWAAHARAETRIRVTNEAELRAAFHEAGAGTTIVLADGTYVLRGMLATRTGGTAAAPIKVVAENHQRAIVESNGAEEAFRVTQPYWWFEGLVIRATRSSNYGMKLEADGHHARIRRNRFEIHPGSEAGIKGAGGATAPWPDHALIERNRITMTAPTTYDLAEGIDAVAVAGWIIRDNIVSGIRTAAGTVAYGIMTKGNSLDTLIERNVVYDCFIGISLGGGGTAGQYMRHGDPTYEQRRGVIRNNVISGSDDVAMYIYAANDSKIYNNTTFNSYTTCGRGCSSIDVRMAGSTADIRNNILDKPINNRDGGVHTASSNELLPAPADGRWFLDALARNFRLRPGAPPIDSGEIIGGVVRDVQRRIRPQGGGLDIGATEQ